MASITAIIAARKAGIEPTVIINPAPAPPPQTAERLIRENWAQIQIGHAVINQLKPAALKDDSSMFYRQEDIDRIVKKVIAALS